MSVANLDKHFSRYIRLKWANNQGYVACCTCGSMFFWKEIHCGHFMSRRHKSTRWHEKNCLPQCVSCNTFNQGQQYKMGKEINKRFGEGTADILLIQSRKAFRATTFEIDALTTFYKKQINNLPNKQLL